MGNTNLKLSLTKKYAALTGRLVEAQANIERIQREQDKLPELEARVVELRDLIAAVELVMGEVDDAWAPDDTKPLKPWTHNIPVPFGSCGRRGMEVLRHSERPMTVREVAFEVLRQVGVEIPDSDIMKRTMGAIEGSFRTHRKKGVVTSSGKYPAQWKSVIKPDMAFDP